MRRRIGLARALLAMLTLVLLGAMLVSSAPGDTGQGDLGRVAGEDADVVEVLLEDRDALDALVATGVDLDHNVKWAEDGIVAHAVVTPNEAATLKGKGFKLGKVVYSDGQAEARVAEREATIAEHEAQNEALEVGALVTDTVKIIRADYYTSTNGRFLSVEAKTSDGQSANFQLTVHRDSGPGTEIGSGGTQNISRFVDAGVYLYHRGASNLGASPRPDYIRVTSPNGGSDVAKVNDWLPLPNENEGEDPYFKDFVTSYMTPTDLYERIEQLHAEFPQLTEIVELPFETNGYRRKAQAILGSTSGGTNQSSAVVVESLAWGHEGGNDVIVELVDPGAPDSALSVAVLGTNVQVSLATDSAGNLVSTAAEVVAALNAEAGSLLRSWTYRGNAGAGVISAPRSAQLSDFLSAPDTVSHEPWTVRAIRIGKTRDGSKMGVLAYAQEHAREWVPPLVTIETAERLLRNYAHDGQTKQLLNNLDIFIIPSVNPDGGHYSFYDFNSQRKNMTNHCPLTGSADPNGRNSWGVDNNRNYDEYSLFDGYSGASTSCTSGTYAGPSELSEPESANVDWIAGNFQNIKFSMNLHSSGNYFMWSPGSYATPGRISAPRPTLAEESFFWGASSRILTAIKQHRGLSVTPARTGPISDVLYSAAGNSGDMLWYKHGIYAWNFEVGTSFQPSWTNAHNETMEFSNGLVELMRVAYDFDKDGQKPKSTVVATPGAEPGTVDVMFDTSEPAAVFYTLDGSRPTYASTLYAAAGIREGAETLTVPAGTTIHWFSVDSAGNIEGNYDPSSSGSNYSKTTVG